MNQAEFEQLLDLYGADIKRWPVALQTDAKAALAAHPDWQKLVDQDLALTKMLGLYTVSGQNLEQLEQLVLQQTVYGKSLLDKFLNWLLPEANILRPALVACLPIVMGLSIGLSVNFEDQFTLEEELSLTGLEPIALELENE
jgi:hypothetical protein